MSKNRPSKLESWLVDPKNLKSRESLINDKLTFDLKLAAAQRGYFLNIYTPEVDQDGFDMIFDDQDRLTKVQLKAVAPTADTKSWKINKGLLRPDAACCKDFDFEPSPEGTGYQGGIIVIDIATNPDFGVTYSYTDIVILSGMFANILSLESPPSAKVLTILWKNLRKGTSRQKTRIDRTMLLRANNPASLLELMGLHNDHGAGIWRYHVQILISPANSGKLPGPRDQLQASVNKTLASISSSIKTDQ